MGLLIQPFETENGKIVMMAMVRVMGFGKSVRLRKWMEKGMRMRREKGVGREFGFLTWIEMAMSQKRT